MITSKQNALIKQIRSLTDKKFRDALGLFVVEGIKPINEAVSLGLEVEVVVCTEKAFSKLKTDNVRVEIVSDELLKFVSEEVTPQGALAMVKKPNCELTAPNGKCLLLDDVSDPSNVGAIIRTAAASGYNEVYLTSCSADAYSQKAVRSSMGGVFRVKIYRASRNDILERINIPLIVADMDGEDVFSFVGPKQFCLVIGNEGNGVSEEVIKKAEYTVKIPMDNGVESLNAAVSAGILMYNLSQK